MLIPITFAGPEVSETKDMLSKYVSSGNIAGAHVATTTLRSSVSTFVPSSTAFLKKTQHRKHKLMC
ncbi:hypothetical protein PAT3040_06822 [Paenibacillus agaridevorans]|uniref:Uncharacterized protein n=1 Tax=Paenibacillus agaridevorans TaxID=171404 RepID=A0A2R5F5A9_9BACL|nr:hypothetical protein PAT3040_06822 [Paenibacillus agaridevorans]